VTAVEYSKLSRPQKIAALLIVAGPEAAAEVLRPFPDAEVEEICQLMGGFEVISQEFRDHLIEEFEPLIIGGLKSIEGGYEFAKKALDLSRGEFKTGAMLSRIGASVTLSSARLLERISEMEGRDVFLLLKREQPQTIAFVLSYIDKTKAKEAFKLFAPEVQADISFRIGLIDSTSLKYIEKIANQLGTHVPRSEVPAFHRSGGAETVANLLKGVSKDGTRAVMTSLEEKNPKLATAVRRKLFSFEDLSRLRPSDMQRLMREVDTAQLALALKGASEKLQEKVFGALSRRAVQGLRDDLSMLTNVRAKEVATAQSAVVEMLRKLEESGDIILDDDDAEL
jgi:flagellar motor switch protein FliG